MAVPGEYQDLVDRTRAFLRDTPELNELKKIQESTDEQIYQALLDGLDVINYEHVPAVQYKTLDKVPSKNLLIKSAVIEILQSAGINSARNIATFRDAGGISITDNDVYGRYINWFNVLINKFIRGVTTMKINDNINAGYGGVGSEYEYIG